MKDYNVSTVLLKIMFPFGFYFFCCTLSAYLTYIGPCIFVIVEE